MKKGENFHIMNLRHKLNVDYIETVRGWGINLFNQIRQKLSVKVFLFVSLLLTISSLLIYFILTLMISKNYQMISDERFVENTNQLF